MHGPLNVKQDISAWEEEVTGNGRKQLIEEVHDMYWKPNTIWMIQSRRMRLVGHVARMGKKT